MDKTVRKTAITLSIVFILSIGLVVAFSVPFGIFPPLGRLLFPGNGVWNIPEEVSSTEVLSIPELSNDVTVLRDQWGIPHIYGESEADILFALGYVHAQDRLFQMDMARRATRGQLSEILGSSMLEADQFALTKMMDYWTFETYNYMMASSDPVDIQVMVLLESYSNGVNYFIDNERNLPLEFLFLNYQPEHWSPSDTFAFIKYMSEMLTWEYSDFLNILIKDAIGMADYNVLYGYSLPYQIPICPDYGEEFDVDIQENKFLSSTDLDESIDTDFVTLSKLIINGIEALPFEQQYLIKDDIIGSNNWVVSGAKTASDKPILCNDMHLSFNLPGIWYEAHLIDTSSDFNIYGFFLAGVPFPIVGHNNYVGWGMTNTAYDVIDWYTYEGINETHYWYKGVPTAYSTVEYSIPVKGQDNYEFVIKSTVHGPVFEGLLTSEDYPEYIDKVIACKWIAQNITFEGRAVYEFAHAKNRADFNEASELFSTPAQNLIYADINNNIAIRPTGKVPIRNDTGIPSWHMGNGTMPYNGSAGQGEWIGYVPFEDLPHSENPSQNYLVSANQLVAGPDYLKNYTLQNPIDISRGYRARRINTLLATNDDITIDDMKAFQLDFYSMKAGNFSSYLFDVLNAQPTLTALQQSAYDLLLDWDFIVSKDSAAPTIFNAFLDAYRRDVFYDDVIDAGSPFYPSTAVLEWFTKNNESTKWFDDVNTIDIETRDDILLKSFNRAVEALAVYFGTNDVSQWLWGDVHQLKIPHITGLSSLGFGLMPIDGDSDTVSPFSATILPNTEIQKGISSFGSSERMIIDFSNLNNSISVIPSGQRGLSTSMHYTDQLMMFLAGEYHTQYFGCDTIASFQVTWIESKIIFETGGN